MAKLIVTLCSIFLLSSCSYYEQRFKNIGQPPVINQTTMPMQSPDYKPVTWQPVPEVNSTNNVTNANSLWKPGARTFFRDQRARRVGDILKVIINIKDNASWANKTEQIRTTKENSTAPNIYGVEKTLKSIFNKAFNPANLLNVTGNDNLSGSGTINRTEALQAQMAAVVTQILPNGNLVIHGKQEIRVNFELREVFVEGIVRPEDISSNNEVSSDLIAEARISYGGRGNITNLQQPRIGNQIIDALSPF